MAYISQEQKKDMAQKLKMMVSKKYPEHKIRYSLKVRNYSDIVLTVREGTIDFIGSVLEPNTDSRERGYVPYCLPHTDRFSGIAQMFINDCNQILYTGNHDNSDIMTDYFDVGWYVTVQIGSWDKPYIYKGE